jgi:peptidoglycan hydrolase-like protein with peptidoglycan-binding domain
LNEGDNDEAATYASQLLRQLGYFEDYPDPYYGWYHVQAVTAFQRDHGLEADGVLGPRTWEALEYAAGANSNAETNEAESNEAESNELGDGGEPTLREGDSSEWAEFAGRLLKELGYLESADMYFGPDDTQALVAFQQQYGLSADGVLGPHTWRELRTVAGQ